ncbi:ribose 5-phosphate isomerase B [Haloplasma contractile]|uniref:Ribose 5-phosphate isomerase B protein n=1 Tax=Haloplasma contractile SSD-17B TaxID=1033810 RepID=U2FJN5_9MOLU|nr:ribose 5-phosphate isomerase B [Haloplasma contractile]ERJ11469.1 ribose 5-phosphate isomerase B protein [Haloplasma contractile SSD-17B]
MVIAVGSDHGGFNLKESIKQMLTEMEIEFKDFGPLECKSVDYPDYAIPVAEAVSKGEFERGILICGTGIGMSIAANKVKGIRAALVSDIYSAKITREHNNSNVLCIGERVTGPQIALEIVKAWIHAEFEGGRHDRRVNKVVEYEK